MQFFKWLYPGLGIKRWIILFALGLALIALVALVAVKFLSHQSVLMASFATALLILGVFLVIMAIRNMLRLFVRSLIPQRESDLVNIMYQKYQDRLLDRGPRVVAIGGGSGLSMLLSGIKNYTKNISAIVTVTDTGGSSGRLRDELGMLPPGDIRNCLVALADAEPLMLDLFQYRFQDGSGLAGHSFGNLFITALSKVTGDFEKAIKESSRVLAIRGRVIPSSLQEVTLVAEFEDGDRAEGETTITHRRKRIRRLTLKPESCEASQEAMEAIEQADLIILGPGSLYTSVLPNLLIRDIQERVVASDAFKIYVANVMTQPGETDRFSTYDHVDALTRHTDPRLIDCCLVNTQPMPESMLKRYEREAAFPVVLDLERIREKGYEVLEGEMIKVDGHLRHDSQRLAKLIFDRFAREGERRGLQTAPARRVHD